MMSTRKSCIERLKTLLYDRFSGARNLGLATVGIVSVALAGCGNGGRLASSMNAGPSVSGWIRSANHPLSGAEIRLFAAAEGTAKPSIPLLSGIIRSNADGRFTVPLSYVCPSPWSQVFVVADGGAPSAQADVSDGTLTMMAALGDCGDLAGQVGVQIDELTTVASVSTLAPFMQSVTSLSAPTTDMPTLRNAFTTARALAGMLEEVNEGRHPSRSYPAALKIMATLADALSACTQVPESSRDEGARCDLFLSYAKPGGAAAPHNTAEALLAILQNPARNVAPIYSLLTSTPIFRPILDAPPAAWAADAASAIGQPVFSPTPGAYMGPQSITLSDSDPRAWIIYNSGGGWQLYTGTFPLTSSATIQAIAIGSSISALATGTYSISSGWISVAVAPAAASVGQSGIGSVSLSSAAPQGGAVVSLSSSLPSVAAIAISTLTVPQGQTAGTFTYKALAPGTAILSASGSGYGSASAQATIVPAVSVTTSPANVSLAPSQAQQFTASVNNTANTAVTWSLNPAVGSISSSGLYTAPASVAAGTTVTVTATSAADATKSAASSISLLPAVTVSVSPTTASLSPMQTQLFTSSVSGAPNTAVTWTVAGVGCTGAACGSISSSGLYTAPAVVSSVATVSITATSQANPTQSATAFVRLTAPAGATYYLSANGSDKNTGLSSSSPWLSPNHPLSCGDTIVAAPGAGYSSINFASGKWGNVTCSAGNNVAWLKCATFDACKISAPSGQFGMYVDHSYWGVQGWEVTVANGGYTCFAAAPSQYTPTQIHHVIFANNVANGCQGGGFGTFASGSVSVDYAALVGNIAYNAAQGTLNCYSGFSIYEPINSDTLPGTHMYLAGNFAWANVNPAVCAGGQPNGGTGLIFDTFDGDQTSTKPYTGQAVAANNILIANGSDGIEVQNNAVGTAHAPVYIYNNTLYGNSTAANINTNLCADLVINSGYNINESGNIVVTNAATACEGHALYSAFVYEGDATDTVAGNWFYAVSGLFDGWYASSGFSMGSNTVANPGFSSPAIPGAPSCGNFGNVPACMATTTSNFAPSNAASGFGYQRPTLNPVADPYFPTWLCTANLPAGLITMGCVPAQ